MDSRLHSGAAGTSLAAAGVRGAIRGRGAVGGRRRRVDGRRREQRPTGEAGEELPQAAGRPEDHLSSGEWRASLLLVN